MILAETARQAASLTEAGGEQARLATLDRLHALAQEFGIVTPYSSMIVLVETRQQQLLEKLENDADRFDREDEQVGGTTPENPMPLAGVPEPEEWLLIGLAVALLLWMLYQKRATVNVFGRG